MTRHEMLERQTGVSLWRQIKEHIGAEILAGRLKPGSRLPPEPNLAERFDVNRHTIRRAIKALADDGLVRAEQGRGTFVQEHGIDYLIGSRTRFSENISRTSRDPRTELLSSRETFVDDIVARGLDVPPGTLCAVLETRHFADGAPLSIASNYFPRDRFPELEHQFTETRSITKALELAGIPDYRRSVSRVTARMPDPSEADLLRQAVNRPIVQVDAVNVDTDGQPIQFSRTRFAADRVQLVVET